MVKSWELNQEFGLEGMPQVPYGAKANPRGWYSNAAFYTSPNMLHIPAGAGIGNGSQVAQTYLAFVWYHTQLLLNDGQGTKMATVPSTLATCLVSLRTSSRWRLKCREQCCKWNGQSRPCKSLP